MTTPRAVLAATAYLSGYTIDELRSDSREQPLTGWRQAAMVACLDLAEMSTTQAARLLGRRDHTTAIHARTAVAANPDLAARLDRIADIVGATSEFEARDLDLAARVERLERILTGPVLLRFRNGDSDG